MGEPARGLRLVAEARFVLLALGGGHELRLAHDLDGHGPVEARVHAQVHDAHGAGAQLLEDLVAPEGRRQGAGRGHREINGIS